MKISKKYFEILQQVLDQYIENYVNSNKSAPDEFAFHAGKIKEYLYRSCDEEEFEIADDELYYFYNILYSVKQLYNEPLVDKKEFKELFGKYGIDFKNPKFASEREIKKSKKQTYKYKKKNSILTFIEKYYETIPLNDEIISLLYKFYVIHSPCEGCSRQKITFQEYGWKGKITDNGLKDEFERILSIENENFIFTDDDNLKECFENCGLSDELSGDLVKSRAVIGQTSENNKILKLFRHIRNCLCHGKFVAVITENKTVSVIMQDNDKYNVTARMILDLEAMINWAYFISKKKEMKAAEILVAEIIKQVA